MLATMWPARKRPRKPASSARRKQSASASPGFQPSAAAQSRATSISAPVRPRIPPSSIMATHYPTSLAFPRRADDRPRPQAGRTAAYEFTAAGLAKRCRWYSAMKYAFPRLQGVMTVSHKEKVSAVGLYGQGGTTPNCLISKHEADE